MTSLKELKLAWRFALREMRGGLKGFYIFIACISLGVAAIGGVNGVSKSINKELVQQGKVILAGDLRVSLNQRPVNDAEMDFLKAQGDVSTSITMQTMARIPNTDNQTMVTIKAVDGQYPLYGRLKTTPQADSTKLFSRQGDAKDAPYGVVVPKILLERLQIKQGDTIKIGNQNFIITAMLDDEPDLLSEGFQLGTRLFMSMDAIRSTNLFQPGSLYTYVYKIKTNNIDNKRLSVIKDQAEKDFPDTGWSVRTRATAAPGFTKNIERFSQFLTLIGLTSLIVGGVGVSNAVRAYMEEKRGVIAAFKSLGASGKLVTRIYFIQIMLITIIGMGIGLIFAMLIPFIASAFLTHYLPIFGVAHIYPTALIVAIVFAGLTASAFSILPLSRARALPVTVLLRDFDGQVSARLNVKSFATVAVLLLATAALAVFNAYDRRMAFIFLISVIGAFIVLRIVASIIQLLARKVSHVRSTALRLAIGNIYRPGALTPSVVLALGLGLTLLVALATIDGNLRNQLSSSVPDQAPDFFFMDIARNDADGFKQLLQKDAPNSILKMMPVLRARITKLNGTNVKDVKIHPDSAWVLRGDRNVTYATTMPKDTHISQGTWWSENQTTGPQVSVSEREGRELGLKLGETISVNVLGNEINAKITSFRAVDWDSFNMNFVMIFSPDTFAGAPHVWLATFKDSKNIAPENIIANEASLMRDIAKQFPSVTIISVRQVLNDAQVLVGQIGTAIRASAAIALLASVLVLAGALSAGNRARAYDAVVLKTLGATRKMLIKAFIYEYAILGLATGIFAYIAGSFAGWSIARYKMDLSNAGLLAGTGITALIVALVLSVGFGLIGTWRVLGQKPASYLKDL